MAWVGVVKADSARSVVPLASAGDGRTYLDTLRVTWDESATGIGPVGQAVRSRKLVVADDIANDPSFAHWRQMALERGYSCVFAAPVIGHADVPDLVLCGFHREPNAYADQVQELLAEFSQRLARAAALSQQHAEHEVGRQRLSAALHGTINALQRMVEARDPYTFGHEERVARLAVAIADALGFPPAQRQALDIAAQLHDIGKMSVPAEILSKPSRLTAAEYELIKSHVDAGYRILEHIDFGMPVAEIVRQHTSDSTARVTPTACMASTCGWKRACWRWPMSPSRCSRIARTAPRLGLPRCARSCSPAVACATTRMRLLPVCGC